MLFIGSGVPFGKVLHEPPLRKTTVPSFKFPQKTNPLVPMLLNQIPIFHGEKKYIPKLR